jgi:hypothetical protein
MTFDSEQAFEIEKEVWEWGKQTLSQEVGFAGQRGWTVGGRMCVCVGFVI